MCIRDRARGLETIIFMMSELRAKQKNIGRFGFIRSPVTFSLIIKRLAIPRPEEISVSPEDWDLMWIDSDDL